LKAIDTAYKERNNNDILNAKSERVKQYLDSKKVSKQQIDFNKEEHIRINQQAKKQHDILVVKADKAQKTELIKLQNEVADKKNENTEIYQRRQDDIRMAIDFSKQHISVSKALQKHEFITNKQEITKLKADKVQTIKNKEKSTKLLLKVFIEQRNKIQSKQFKDQRIEIDDRIRRFTQHQIIKSLNRVNELKEKKAYHISKK
jgi:hypothetical protein